MTERDWEDAHLVNAARDIHADDPAFGYRFIADELPEKGMKSSLAVSALENAVRARRPARTVVHSDRGSQDGFNRSSQHLDCGGSDGQAGRLDESRDGQAA